MELLIYYAPLPFENDLLELKWFIKCEEEEKEMVEIFKMETQLNINEQLGQNQVIY